MDLWSSIEKIKGVGPETARKLAVLGVETIYDLLTFWPRRYDDYSEVLPIKDIEPGAVTVKAMIESIKTKRVRRGMHLTEAVIRDESSAIRVVWFNQPYREKYFKAGKEYYFSGLYDFSFNRYVLQNPTVEEAKEFTANTARIVPIYPQTKGLDSKIIRKTISEITSMFQELSETMPSWVSEQYDFMSYAEAAYQLHWPENQTKLAEARERIGFEEVFAYVLAGQLNKKQIEDEVALPILFNQDFAKQYTKTLPFELTPEQKQCSWEILQDIEREHPMNRLLEGDVGAGKTVVAAMAAYMASKQGIQTAIMAPTELLARQHAVTLANLLEPLGVTIGLLTSAVKGKPKEALKSQLEEGSLDIVVGTHALLQESVTFKRLGLIVIDEQHRFGVKQRQKLVDKAEKIPHILSMTATPIPRSLALTVYGELDISIINSKPKNRLPIQTNIWSPNSRPQLYQIIDDEIKSGRQAFVVCPLIDESEGSEVKSVNEEVKRLKKDIFKTRRIGTLHGKMKDDEKARVMQDFADKKLDILVSTTVIEVGIDIPNASVMLIEGADQFGLAQLHQLRGRVGRGEYQGYCYLVPTSSQKPSKRLRAMESTRDGFKLAEMDLELRGPGAIYGSKQHGALDLKIANISDVALIKNAKKSAAIFIKRSDNLADYQELEKRVQKSLSLTYLN
ncbi:ATP-dependent DNA helicase RecG [Candidatus Saccharibacteria bacterium]|jgi:ATP-dependent DNA helicase RecG|nr:ATP-dependent DNA helicase RecG [Candidatus Saccharibacteria bacterium]MCA9313304.1 ATP-dependent DNA helicase RecG [Candidatus Saccharibacteria bacterium]